MIAAVPAVALAVTTVLLRSEAPAGTAGLATGLAGAGVVASVILALAVARTITGPLQRLGEAAERAAHLQTFVEALRRPSGKDQDLALTPVGLPPGGEIGGVAQAFDAFQGAAARLAVGQAALLNKTVAEKGTIEVFVNLARRMQGLVDHQIEFLDGLEAEERDSDTLDNLFKLDQLATRVRRNAESLLTLAGAASARSWERPLAMSDVIRAGMAEVEDIGRVDLLVDDKAAMIGNVAADAAHLLSELLENATRWSPPDTRVEVTGSPAAGGYAISIEDRGIGMTVDALAEANHILTGPPLAEATVARSLGLVVAGRLARRLGIVVRLATAGTGIVAKVLVPSGLMVAADETIGLEEVAGPARTLPFALARQEKRARISSQRSRSRHAAATGQGEATITQLPESRWIEPAPAEPESRWIEPPAPSQPEWPAAESKWSSAEPAWTPSQPEWPAAEPQWPAAAAPVTEDAPSAPAPSEPARPSLVIDDGASPEPVDSQPEWTAELTEDPEPTPAPVVEPEWPAVAEPEPAAATLEPEWPAAATRQAEVTAAAPPVDPLPTVAADPPPSLRPTPTVRPARFAASSSRPLAGSLPTRAPVPSAEAKEDEYRRHLERATAAGLVRRVPKASLPNDTGGGARRVPKSGGDQAPVAERLPDEVRSLLSSYRSGVQRGRVDDPSDDHRTTTPQEQP